MDPKWLFSLDDHPEALSQHDDLLEVVELTGEIQYFRGWLVEGLLRWQQGDRPPFDAVAMFTILIPPA